jgi:hypothetical protein
MKRILSALLTLAAAAALVPAVHAQCTNATLTGNYAFSQTGFISNAQKGNPLPAANVGVSKLEAESAVGAIEGGSMKSIARKCLAGLMLLAALAEPHPSSCGSISQGAPLHKTNRMPTRHVLSGKRGLPPLGFALGIGTKGSTSFHNLLGRSSAAIGQSS